MQYNYLSQDSEHDIEKLSIESARCKLEPFRMGWIDFADLQKAFVEANENFFVSPHHPDIEQERLFISEAINARQNGESLEFFIFDKASDRLIGCMGITSLNSNEPNLGLWIRKEFHGKWYGTEVYAAFLDWAKRETNFTFFKHAVDPKNEASIKLAKYFQGEIQKTFTERGHEKYYIYLK